MKKRLVTDTQRRLRVIGWKISVDGELGPETRRAIRKFQNGYAIGPALVIDGRLGPKTFAAIIASAKNGGACSDHFRFVEFASKGNGDIVIERGLIRALERLRDKIGKSIPIVSGYRDPYHNDVTVGGASFSQHKYGTAADVPESLEIPVSVATLAGFSGIGYDGSSNFVQHVDVRHLGPNNTTGASRGAPTTWRY